MMLTSVELVLALSSLSLQALALCDVIDYGAVGDGLTNDTEAIHASIQDCMKPGKSRDVYFPAAHNFATWPLRFEGSQWANFTLTFDGNLTNMALPSSWPSDRPALISFVSVANVTIQGQGWLLGKGQAWWQIRRATPSAFAPRIIEFDHSSKLVVTDISLLNSPIWNLKFDNCIDVSVSNITIVAPFDSPNTDGIDLDSCHFATVDGVRISNGDDEVAIGGSSSNILVQNSLFANGHGASIGSIGENNGTGFVSNITFRNLSFTNTANVARIKTWQGGHGAVKNITYDGITTTNTRNTIYITQFYCPHSQHAAPCKNYTAAVAISDIVFRNVRGSYVDAHAGQLLCADSMPCQNILLDNVHLQSSLGKSSTAVATSPWACWQVNGQATNVTPACTCFDSR